MSNTPDPFAIVRTLGLALPGVQCGTKYDGSPLLKRDGSFMAGLATHRSTEPNTLIVRATLDDRQLLIAEAPETYYITEHYRRHPVVLVRLSQISISALRDLLSVSWRLTGSHARVRAQTRHL